MGLRTHSHSSATTGANTSPLAAVEKSYKMDFVPFTIFYMACLTVFHGNLASSSGCRVTQEWPERCANQAYCFVRPADYPSTPELKKMLENSGFDISKLETSKPIDRSSSELCRHYQMIDPIYMIKDANNAVRYVVQDPNLVNQIFSIEPCKKQIHLLPMMTCEEVSGQQKFLVLTCDRKGVEYVNHAIPTSCSVRKVNDYEYDD